VLKLRSNIYHSAFIYIRAYVDEALLNFTILLTMLKSTGYAKRRNMAKRFLKIILSGLYRSVRYIPQSLRHTVVVN